MHLIREPLSQRVCSCACVCVWVARGRLISKWWHSPIKVHRVWRPRVGEKGHWRSLASRSWEHHSGSVRLTSTAAANILRFMTCPEMAIKEREREKTKTSYVTLKSHQGNSSPLKVIYDVVIFTWFMSAEAVCGTVATQCCSCATDSPGSNLGFN